MLHSIEGIYQNGKIELFEVPKVVEKVRVIVTFLDYREKNAVNLGEIGISKDEAAEARARLAAFAEDWENPEMEIYDDL